MIVYFSDRQFNILGHASTKLPSGLTVVEDLKTEDVETGVAVFECIIPYNAENREDVEKCAEVGNYLLRNNGNETEFYTIIDSESDTKNQEVYIYVEDAGLDLLNEIVGAYEADKAYPITHYINMYAYDSGFTVGINEAANLTRKLSWDGECTATERIASIATQFDGCEVAYSFEIDGLVIKNKYINIYKERGKDIGAQLRLNYDIDRIITKKSIKNLATGLKCTGGTPENSETPITLKGYKYDDGNFYVSGDRLYSREALKKWTRYAWKNEPNQIEGQEGHIVRPFSYDTTEQATLFAHALTELKKLCEIEVNYEVEINKLPDNVKVGDRVNIIDDAGELYVSTRVLKLETSVANQKQTATLGEFLIKGSGISQKVADLAAEFAKLSVSAARAKTIADNAKAIADEAKGTADEALVNANNATTTANEAQTAASNAMQSASEAQTAASNAETAVQEVEKDISEIEQSVANAEAAATQAQQAAQTAESKATEAKEAATKATEDAEGAKQAAEQAQSELEITKENAETAKSTADQAKTKAEEAATTAAAAKLDAENAQKDIDELGENLTTVENTMKADYARKTDLTEATASLQTQITQNAAEISSTASRVQTIDETANNASEQAQAAQSAAQAAQAQADQALADATASQTAADEAKAAANSAQSEADKAKVAAATAQSVADKAKTDLEAAQADLATVQGRVDATEEEIAAAQQAVTNAQNAADKAQEDADEAATKAANAQTVANNAATDAANAQTAANEASSKATIAQQVANEAKGNAEDAIATANEAKANAQNAIATANTAKTNAESAQAQANQAKEEAEAAQQAADDAEAKAQAAQSDLNTAKQNLANVTARVGATEEEVAAAQQAVETAQAAADKAKADAATAQSTADTAKANAATAQTAANNAKTTADNAQQAADEAQDAADKAQADVDALAVRVTNAETSITQNAEQIALRATKEEVTETLGGYYKKTETDAAITVKANEIKSTVGATYTTKEEFNALEIGGRNLLRNSKGDNCTDWTYTGTVAEDEEKGSCVEKATTGTGEVYVGSTRTAKVEQSEKYTFSCDVWVNEYVKDIDFFFLSDTEDAQKTGDSYVNINCFLQSYKPTAGEWQRITKTFTTKADDYTGYIRIDNNGSTTSGSNAIMRVANLKLEKGNKATDWTPAPEDVDAKIDDTASSIREEVVHQIVEVSQTNESYVVKALESYTKTEDFEAYKQEQSTEFGVFSDQITGKVTKTEEDLKAINADLQAKINTITKYFTFDVNGLTIGQVDSPYKVIIDNDRYSMTVNGVEVMWIADGKVYTPEIEVTKAFRLFGYLIEQDANGNVNCGYVGGES